MKNKNEKVDDRGRPIRCVECNSTTLIGDTVYCAKHWNDKERQAKLG